MRKLYRGLAAALTTTAVLIFTFYFCNNIFNSNTSLQDYLAGINTNYKKEARIVGVTYGVTTGVIFIAFSIYMVFLLHKLRNMLNQTGMLNY